MFKKFVLGKPLLLIGILLLLMYSCGGSDDSPAIDPPIEQEEIIPTNLTLSIKIEGENSSNPNGDGSGLVKVEVSAINAVNYVIKFGDGEEVNTATGIVEHTYSKRGTNNYIIYANAYSSTENSISEFEQLSVYVNPDVYKDLVFSDEFDVDGKPDSSKWTFETGRGSSGWGNNELQYYTDRIENAVVTEGHLNIIAKRENYEGAEFTSARMITYGKFDFTYGKIEVRAKLPEGVGTWPAIWMLGKSVFDSSVGWPKCGEIDIMEHVGKDQDNVHSSIHNGESSGATRFSAGKVISGVSEEFHIYSAMWYEDEIVFYVDGNQLYSYRPSIMDENYWPFYNPQFLILNIAMGGNWGGPVDENFTESSMEIDYVRIYQ